MNFRSEDKVSSRLVLPGTMGSIGFVEDVFHGSGEENIVAKPIPSADCGQPVVWGTSGRNALGIPGVSCVQAVPFSEDGDQPFQPQFIVLHVLANSDMSIGRHEAAQYFIFEDWSPINARKHSWDSPLAGHAVSANGIDGYSIVAPAVDERTKPTGKMAEYLHPHWKGEDPKRFKSNVAKYEIHEPEQDAYGDWAAISIGGQYYLFCDFHPAHKGIRIAWFTSSSIDKPFSFCGEIGKGHPDPDIGFAEGRFYLVTQTANDYVSPGPWVEKVEARVGVDTNKDGKADLYQTVNAGWGLTDNYHEYTFGPVRDSKGNFYGTLNTSLSWPGWAGSDKWDKARVHDSKMGRAAKYRGWSFQITPQGKFVPYSMGMRSPAGIGIIFGALDGLR